MKSWLRCILIVNFRVRNKIPKIPNAHQIVLKLFRKQNIKGYEEDNRKVVFFFLCLLRREPQQEVRCFFHRIFCFIPIGENPDEVPICQRGFQWKCQYRKKIKVFFQLRKKAAFALSTFAPAKQRKYG